MLEQLSEPRSNTSSRHSLRRVVVIISATTIALGLWTTLPNQFGGPVHQQDQDNLQVNAPRLRSRQRRRLQESTKRPVRTRFNGSEARIAYYATRPRPQLSTLSDAPPTTGLLHALETDSNPRFTQCNERAGFCDVPHNGVGCNTISCCESVCAADGFCCDIRWDDICEHACMELVLVHAS